MDRDGKRRLVEALILASPEPISAARLADLVPHGKPGMISELVRERLLEPLGMLGTAYALDEVADRMVRGHDELTPASSCASCHDTIASPTPVLTC